MRFLAVFRHFPDWAKSRLRAFRREVDGGAAITACGLAKLGIRVAVLGVGAVGSEDGAWVIKRLSSYGVGCSMAMKQAGGHG